jgi:hypothetical protein
MPVLANPKHELIAQGFASGKKARDVLGEAGYSPNPRNGTSYKKKPEIRNRIKEILEHKTLDLELNIANLTKMYFFTFNEATAANQHSAAKGCLDSLVKLHGLMVEREDRTKPLGLSADERNKLIAALEELESPPDSGTPAGNIDHRA